MWYECDYVNDDHDDDNESVSIKKPINNETNNTYEPTIEKVKLAYELWLSTILDTNVKDYQKLKFYYLIATPLVEYIGGISDPYLHIDYYIRFEYYQIDFNILKQSLVTLDYSSSSSSSSSRMYYKKTHYINLTLPHENSSNNDINDHIFSVSKFPYVKQVLDIFKKNKKKSTSTIITKTTTINKTGTRTTTTDSSNNDNDNKHYYRKFYTIKSRKLIEKQYEIDLNTFHYKF